METKDTNDDALCANTDKCADISMILDKQHPGPVTLQLVKEHCLKCNDYRRD